MNTERDREATLVGVFLVLGIIFTLLGSTLAYFIWRGNITSINFTITRSFECSGDMGGPITSNQLAPASCTNSIYAVQREVTINPVINSPGVSIYMDLWLDVEQIDEGLANTEYFKYALTSNPNSCTDNVIEEGTFRGKDKVELLSSKPFTYQVGLTQRPDLSQTYYLYVWLDADETDTATQGSNFTLTLGGQCTQGEYTESTGGNGSSGNGGTLSDVIRIEAESGSGNAAKYTGEGASSFANDVYYFKGSATNTNVLFANHCWQMIRTTDTGGVKLLYNGTPEVETPVANIAQSEYVNVTNDTTYPYTFDSSNLTWTSTNKTNSKTGTISFSVSTTGDYLLSYSVSSEAKYDKAYFYLDGNQIGEAYSGTVSGTLELNGLTTSNVIMVKYTKDGSGSSGSDSVTFSIGKAVGESITTCNNTGNASRLPSTKKFNKNDNSPAYVGYMYSTVYASASSTTSTISSDYVYGNSFTYSNGTYTLSGSTTTGAWSSIYNKLSNTHYTCLNNTGTCTDIKYIYYTSSSTMYYITLTGGKSVNDALSEMLWADDVNETDSTIKDYIDTWYASNMTSYTSYLEDTVYCNDRSIDSLGGWNPNGGSTSSDLRFYAYNKKDLTCTNKNDRFTMSSTLGNGKLTYPVGLMTAGEANLIGWTLRTTGQGYWLGSPYYFRVNALGFNVADSGNLINYRVYSAYGARPVVSLKPGIEYVDGEGSVNKPFLIVKSIPNETAPSCTFEDWTDSEISTGERTTIKLNCVDEGTGVSTTDLTSEDFIVTGAGSIGVGTVTYVDNSSTRSYTITVTGGNVGSVSMLLKAGSVSDGEGNTNIEVTSDELTVTVAENVGVLLSDVIRIEAESGSGNAAKYTGEGASSFANDVYYFTGSATNTNVLFANHCWQMIRTTETGGVKLLYNGIPTNGACNNTGTASQLPSTKEFNTKINSPAYVGYMYNTVYASATSTTSTISSDYVYGNSFTYSNGTYTLSGSTTTGAWSSIYNKLSNTHYTCLNNTGTCTSIKYIYYTSSSTMYYITLTGGKSVNDALNEMLWAADVNETDSIIKDYIDTWYASNMTSYTSYLEDTVYCNDRSIYQLGSWNPNGGSTTDYLYFYANNKKDLTCTNKNDRFTMNSTIGNGKLTYPVGLMTAGEANLIGRTLITTGEDYRLGSPSSFGRDIAAVSLVVTYGFLGSVSVSNAYGVRPVVSLKPGTQYVDGEGSSDDPFLVE